jgi:prophage antirepressor-like protein
MTKVITSTTKIIFNHSPIRAVLIEGQYWFVAKDIAKALGIRWYSKIMEMAQEGQKKKLYHQLFCDEGRALWLLKYNALYVLLARAVPKQACALMELLTLEALPAYFDTKVENTDHFFNNIWQTMNIIYQQGEYLMQLNERSAFSTAMAKTIGVNVLELSRNVLLGTAMRMRGNEYMALVMDKEQQEVAHRFNNQKC